jgi:hypothetical protein
MTAESNDAVLLPCPFCRNASSEFLSGNGVSLAAFSRYASEMRSEMRFPFGVVDGVGREESRAAEWVGVIPGRDDVYEVLLETAEAAVAGQAQPMLGRELSEERELLLNIADVMRRLAGESIGLETPMLDAVVAELETHSTA